MRGLNIRRRRAMFSAQGRARKRQLSLFRKLGVFGILLVFVALLVIGLGWPNIPGQATKAHITFAPAKKLFTVSERPELHLHISSGPRLGLLQQKVYADDLPQAKVDFDGRLTPETATVTPEAGGYKVTLNDNNEQPKAGTYDVTVTGQTNDGQNFKEQTSFTWGALAFNTDKTVYAPGETAQLQFGVVGPRGNTMCNAALAVTITDPSGHATSDIAVNPSNNCKGDVYSDISDYTASYQTAGVGTYTVAVGIQKTPYTITDTFKVESSAPFDVARTGLTRLLPSHTYDMSLNVRVNQDFAGQVQEQLANTAFKVQSSSNNAAVSEQNGRTTLAWDVQWKAGTTQVLRYSFMPPPKSPAFYQSLPATFTDQAHHAVFTEVRGWQYVGDAIITFVKQTEFSVRTSNLGPPNSSGAVAATSTTGNTLILLFVQDDSGTVNGLGSVTDSTTGGGTPNNWIKPGSNPNQNPPANSFSGTSTEVAMAYVTVATAITSITVTVASVTGTKDFAFNLVEFSNIDIGAPVDQSASTTSTGSGGTPDTQFSPTVNTTTCDSATMSEVLRGGNYFCSSPNELVITIIQSGKSSYVIDTSTDAWLNLTDMQMNSGSNTPNVACTSAFSSCGDAAYIITPTTKAYQAKWTVTPANGVGHNTATGIMVFRQLPDPTTDISKKNFFWAR